MDENAKFRSFDDLNEAADRGELTEAELKIQLANYALAYKQEFAEEEQAKDATTATVENARELFKKNAGLAAAQIVFLSINGQNDGVKLAASKYIYEQAKEDPTGKGGEMDDLLAKLQKAESKPS